jgi:hypothetical protein
MTQPSEHAYEIASRFRDPYYELSWFDSGDVQRPRWNNPTYHVATAAPYVVYRKQKILALDAQDQFWIRWPADMHIAKLSTLRGVLNGLLRGLRMGHDTRPLFYAGSRNESGYVFTLHRQITPKFWCYEGGKWKDQHMTIGEWMPIVEGELARMAMAEARRRGAQPIFQERT